MLNKMSRNNYFHYLKLMVNCKIDNDEYARLENVEEDSSSCERVPKPLEVPVSVEHWADSSTLFSLLDKVQNPQIDKRS